MVNLAINWIDGGKNSEPFQRSFPRQNPFIAQAQQSHKLKKAQPIPFSIGAEPQTRKSGPGYGGTEAFSECNRCFFEL